MPKFVDDELTDAKPSNTTKAAVAVLDEDDEPTNKKAVQLDDEDEPKVATKGKAAPAAEEEDVDVEWGDEKLMSKSDGLDRLRPEKGKVVRFAIVPYIKPKSSHVHYVEGRGNFRCLTPKSIDGKPVTPAECCKKLGESKLRVVALVLHYANAVSKDGSMKNKNGEALPIEWELKFVQLGQANYRDISLLKEEDQEIYDLDIKMSHNNRAFGYDFHRATAKALYKRNPALVKEVEEACKVFSDGEKLSKKLGKKVTPLELKAVIASLSAGAEDANLDDVENL